MATKTERVLAMRSFARQNRQTGAIDGIENLCPNLQNERVDLAEVVEAPKR